MPGKTKVTGFNIYKDKLNRDIYYDFITKEGYVITQKNLSKFNFYKKRFIIPVILFALTYTLNIAGFEFGITGAGALALISLVVTEFVFRFKFLRSTITVPNFVPNKKENYFHQLANSSPLVSLILKGVLYIILGGLLVVFGYQEGFETLEWVACIVITIVLIAVGLCQLIAAIIKNKTK